jgi:integrase/recombinase XerD
MNLSDFQNYLILNHDAKNTQVAYFSQAKMYHKYFSEFNQENLNAYLTKRLEEGISKTTFNFIINALKSYAKYLKLTIEWPKYKTPNKGTKDFLTEEELKELCPYMDMLFPDGHKRRLILWLMFSSGLRPCEVTKLKKTDLLFDKGRIVVRDTKDKEDRVTILISELCEDLKNEIAKSETEYAFNITDWYTREIFDKINNELHYKKHVNRYMLRHGFAHKCLKDGIDIVTLQKMLGHWDIQMTKEYLKLTNDEIIENALKKFKLNKGGKT